MCPFRTIPAKSAEPGAGGLLTYGGFDNEHCEKDIKYVPLSSRTYWQFEMKGFKIGALELEEEYQVISDTGTSWIGVPSDVFFRIAIAIGARYDYRSGFLTIDCEKQRKGHTISIKLDGVTLKIPPIEYILDLGLGYGKCVVAMFQMSKGGMGPAWIFGDPLIRTYCNIHDVREERIGFARSLQKI
ncbi:hypothetical protein AB6A40_010077 [Gnathostoma spinigerum]|uniref:Peptidase A1 domain-containing protein n=1 Tax=Gnathostoma spinigerum TaxID=75299 RepID=A0ABD6F136_9BILA